MTAAHPTAQHAMAGMKRDRETFAVEESNGDAGYQAVDSPMLKGDDPVLPPKKKTLRDSKAQRPPSLAATHPVSYSQQARDAKTMPPPSQKRIKLEATIKPELKPLPQPREPMPLCRQIHDPKGLISYEPLLAEPMYRHLSSDTKPDRPKVISPTFMIALPLGTLIEGANYYPGMEQQPRDAPNA